MFHHSLAAYIATEVSSHFLCLIESKVWSTVMVRTGQNGASAWLCWWQRTTWPQPLSWGPRIRQRWWRRMQTWYWDGWSTSAPNASLESNSYWCTNKCKKSESPFLSNHHQWCCHKDHFPANTPRLADVPSSVLVSARGWTRQMWATSRLPAKPWE